MDAARFFIMISVTFLSCYKLHGNQYSKGQIAYIDPATVAYLVDIKIVRVTHRKDAEFLLYQKARNV